MSQPYIPVQPVTVEHLLEVRQLLREGLAGERSRAIRFLLMLLAVYTLAVYGLSLLAPYIPAIHNASPDDQYEDMTFVMFAGLLVWVAGYMVILSMSRRWMSVSPQFLATLHELSPPVPDQSEPVKRLRLAHVDEILIRVEHELKEQLRGKKMPTLSLASSTEKIFHTIN